MQIRGLHKTAALAGNRLPNIISNLVLRTFAANFNYRPSLKKYLKTEDGFINFTLGIQTEDGSVEQAVSFNNGKVRISGHIPEQVDARLIFMDTEALKEVVTLPPNELMNALMKNRLITEGNLGYVQVFNFYLSLLLKKIQIKKLTHSSGNNGHPIQQSLSDPSKTAKSGYRKHQYMPADKVDPGVKFLDNPYLSQFSLDDFPRLKQFLDIHFSVKPEICSERPEILTRWYREHGFEKDKFGNPWDPVLRQAKAFKYLMDNRKPIIRKGDLVAGTTTTKEIGVVLYPDAHGTMIWGELLTVPYRPLNPYDIDQKTIDVLHHQVFPFWIKRNFREWVRETQDYPLYQKLDERFAVYFMWKTAALSHTIIDYPKILKSGTAEIIAEIQKKRKRTPKSNQQKRHVLDAMEIALQGINCYAGNLARQARQEAQAETSPVRKKELARLADICSRVPAGPCKSLDEAVNALWILWLGVHMENTNAGFSLGRLDQWLQPYFEADMKKLSSTKARRDYIKHAVELIGCFYMRCTDHLPLVPDIGNYLFGGSSSDQAITLGGVTPEGEDAVNDMTYIFLKVTEILGIRDPNVNARYHGEKNSQTYLKRLCEVNVNTTATPSIHNDDAVIRSLQELKYKDEHIRDWAATGCVEPTLSGRHMGHTNCMMFNMVAALEMAMNNGRHPLMRWAPGPRTGDINKGDFKAFEQFFKAFCTQFQFLADQSVTYNNILGKAHQVIRPTPYISSLMEGPIRKGKDVTHGGARYNSSGTALIGLADVTDSLMVIKKLVFETKQVSFPEILNAVNSNFKDHTALLAMAKNRVPLFGSGDPEALAMAKRITRFAHDLFARKQNYRGGRYTTGFWSMSNHVAFGTLTGALPSGRLAGKAFTPGLTPEPHASKNLLDNLRDVAQLDAKDLNNNIAFNVKVVPAAKDSHDQVVDHLYAYVKTYTDLGGMQMQFNVVSSDTLRDAMIHPENYQNLLVRISGYNAYFVTLNPDMQLELIERAEYGV